jgi:acetyl-CoA acetyltransferase
MNEFIAPYGVYTAVEFALMARRHMTLYGTTSEQMATVAATIRNNGHINPEAIYYGRGPYTPTDILESRMIADPFHLLDCCLTGEGGTAILVTSHDRAKDLRLPPVYVLGGGQDTFSAPYHHAPSWDLGSRRAEERVGLVGRRAAKLAFEAAGLNPSDVDCCEFYDVFSFEIIRQFEAFGFCGEGEGGDFVMDGKIGPDGTFPVTTDGGTLSYSHTGTGQMLQRAGRGVLQLQRLCTTNQIEDVDVVMCSVGGSGAMFSDVMLLGSQRP